MPFKNYHAARQNNPKKYDSFRYSPVPNTDGLFFVYGIFKENGKTKTEVQAVRADKDKWTTKRFAAWLKDNNFNHETIEEAVMDKAIQLFSLYTTLDIEKGKDNPDKVKIGGIISSDTNDQEGDVLLQEGMDWSYFLERGYFNYEHQQGPENILGVPDKVELVDMNGKKATKVEGFLLMDTPKAKDVYQSIKAVAKAGLNRQIGFSVEGQVIERDLENPKIVKRAKILNVSITAHPVNPDAKLELLARSLMIAEKAKIQAEGKSKEEIARMILEAHPELSDEEIMSLIHKLLGEMKDRKEAGEVGYQTPAQTGGGSLSALVPQSIEGKPANASFGDEEFVRLIIEEMKMVKGEYDDKSSSLRQAKQIEEYAMKMVRLIDLMEEDVDLPEWCQSKITKALDYLQSVYHYLDMNNEAYYPSKEMNIEDEEEKGYGLENDSSKMYKKDNVLSLQEFALMLMSKFPHLSVGQAREMASRLLSASKR